MAYNNNNGPGTGQLRVGSYRQSNIGNDGVQAPFNDDTFMSRIPEFNRDLSPGQLKKIASSIPPPNPPAQQISISSVFYVHIDSRQRVLYPENILDDYIIELGSYPLVFENGSPIMSILIEDNDFKIGDRITIGNVISKNLVLLNPLSLKNSSMYVRINQKNHGMSLFGLYDPTDPSQFKQAPFTGDLPRNYHRHTLIPDLITNYVLIQNSNLFVTLNGIKGSNINQTQIGNLPINYLNQTLEVVLIFNLVNGLFVMNNDAYLIKLMMPANINYRDTDNTVLINYLNLFGVPIAIINSGTPNTVERQIPFYDVIGVSRDEIQVDLTVNAIVDPFVSFYAFSDGVASNIINEQNRGGGNNVIIQKVLEIIPGFPHPNNYLIRLNTNYRNVSQVRMISSIFPNSFRVINVNNNKLYWRNLMDGEQIYYLTIQPGNYAPCQFAKLIEKTFNSIPRASYCYASFTDVPIVNSLLLTLINNAPFDPLGNYKYQEMEVTIDTSTSIVTFKTFRKIKLLNPLSIPNYAYDINIDVEYMYHEGNLYSGRSMMLNTNTAIIVNFFSQIPHPHQESASINTETTLEMISFDPLTNILNLPNHSLLPGDLFWTDLFDTSGTFFYQITSIVDENTVNVIKSVNSMLYKNFLLTNGYEMIDVIRTPVIGNNQYLWVTQPNHELSVGDEIRIEGSLAVDGACPEVLNNCFKINRIINKNKYEIILPTYVPCDINSDNNVVIIRYPDLFQLFFNFPDTFGNILAFRRPGEPLSITPYASIIRNIDPYNRDFNFAGISQSFKPSNKPIIMTGETYFYIISQELGQGLYQNTNFYQDNGNVVGANFVFAKIQVSENAGDYLLNSFVPVIKVFPSLASINQLTFRFVNPNGTEVDFQDADHTFVLEFTVVNNVPVRTNVDTNIDSTIGPRTLGDFGMLNINDDTEFFN